MLHRTAFALALAVASMARATTFAGTLATDTHWTASDSPIVVTDDVTVPRGVTLTIDPGVTVKVTTHDPTLGLDVLGTLVANGTATQPIVFEADFASRDAWRGVRVSSNAPGSSLSQLALYDATDALVVDATAPVTLSDLAIVTTETGLAISGATTMVTRPLVAHAWKSAITLSGSARVELDDATVQAGRADGIEVVAPASAVVKRARIVVGARGVEVHAGASLELDSSIVAGNTGGGLLAAQASGATISLVNDTFDRNAADPLARAGGDDGGLHFTAIGEPAKAVVRNCIVANHGTTGVRVDGGGFVTLDSNDVWNNATDYQGATADANSISADPLFLKPLFASPPDAGATWNPVSYSVVEPAQNGPWEGHWYVELYGAGWLRANVTQLSTGSNDALRVIDRAGDVMSSYSLNDVGASAPATGSYLALGLDVADGSRATFAASFESLPLAYDYSVAMGSPVIDAGSATGAPTTDVDGVARPHDGRGRGDARVDIGASEYHGNVPPVADAGGDRDATTNEAVLLDGSASHDADGQIVLWDWDFGDGSAHGDRAVESHVYAAAGSYVAKLTVTDDDGAKDAATVAVTVSDSAPGGHSPVARVGGESVVNEGAPATFDGSASTDDDGAMASYSWDFGDGGSATGATVTHVFHTPGPTTVTLTVTDDAGLSASASLDVRVNALPVAIAGGDRTLHVNEAGLFDGSASTDADGRVVRFLWSIDGHVFPTAKVHYAWQTPGDELATLTVTDDDGATARATIHVHVVAGTLAVSGCSCGLARFDLLALLAMLLVLRRRRAVNASR